MAQAQQVTRPQEAVITALLDPRNKHITDVARAAGVSRASVYKARQQLTVQRELEARKAPQRDTARSIYKRSLSKISQDLDTVTDTDYPLKALTVTTKALVDLGDEAEADASPTEARDRLRSLGQGVVRVHLRGIMLALADPDAARALLERVSVRMGLVPPCPEATGGQPRTELEMETSSCEQILEVEP